MLKEKRAARGNNMGILVGEAIAQGDAFWQGMGDENGSDDDSFNEVEAKPDVFDSDFNDTEDEGSDSNEEEKSRKSKKDTNKDKSKNKYVEPVPKKSRPVVKKQKTDRHKDSHKDNADFNFSQQDQDVHRFVRESTKKKTQGADERLAQSAAASARYKQRITPQVKHQFTQKELLLDALNTEVINAKWIQSQKLAEDERAAATKPARTHTGVMKRTLSRRGSYTTITFVEDEAWPSLFSLSAPTPIPQQICSITGLPAKYRDPQTGQPYATLEAFSAIRKRLNSSSKQKIK